MNARVRSIQCPECGGCQFITDDAVGETVCNSCGLIVHDNMLDKTPEWRAYTVHEKQTRIRVGPPPSLVFHDKGLSTTFNPYYDTTGNRLPVHERLKTRARVKMESPIASIQDRKSVPSDD